MDIFAAHVALTMINKKPIFIIVISISKRVFAGRKWLNLNINIDFTRSKRIFSTYDYFLPKYNDLILSKNNGLEMLFLCNRNEYIFCSDKRVIFWEQIVLNGIPTLLSLTYLAVSRMVEEKKKKAVSLSMENAESMTVPSVENNAIDQPVYKKSILQRFQRLFAKKKVLFKLKMSSIYL
jgi:hypothetical protein